MFRNEAAEFVYTRTYSRWLDDQGRRETWPETVERFVNFIVEERGDLIPKKVIRKIRESMLAFDVMPSMRAVWAAGPAAKADNTCLYNCSFQVVDSIDSFAECLYILMCGTGYGFSVEKHWVDNLPVVSPMLGEGAGTYIVPDSKEGWATSVRELVKALYSGKDLDMDYSLLRAKGARLKTMGGRSSGPAPLINLHNFLRTVFQGAQGRQLTTLECHDICNQIAEIVVVGGVRRSSEISLSDLNDEAMRHAKEWPYPLRRAMANNSAVYLSKPSAVDFLKEWSALAASGTGERGIFNLAGARERSPARRKSDLIMGTNPCAEILLRSKEFCNLSEVVVRAADDVDTLLEKVETAVWIGVIQSTFTYFPYLSKEWKENCEEERLLGVSMTGQMDNVALMNPEVLKALKAKSLKVAKKASQIMGINMPAAITCVKPSGTVSQLVDSASGVHPRYSQYYIRRYRIASTDPLFRMMRDQGIKFTPENGSRKSDWDKAAELKKKGDANYMQACPIFDSNKQWSEDLVSTWVVGFPVKAPDNCITRNDMSAIEQLEHYKMLQQYWCEHNASTTIYVKDSEWFEVGNWVYKNWDIVNGVSFLPHDGGKYEQAPYEEITKEQYEDMVSKMPKINYSELSYYELEDNTEGSKTLACVAGVCEI
jgi:ribonucleoside-diphosphate reductase alpha chain